jgi:enoyl-CoA hydratase/carnithine racemase
MSSVEVRNEFRVAFGERANVAFSGAVNPERNEGSASTNLSGACASGALHWKRIADRLVVAKSRAGFEDDSVHLTAQLLAGIANHEIAGLRYLIYDFAHQIKGCPTDRTDAFEELVSANSELILTAPVISIAWVRSDLSGADLEFALSCSMIVATRGASFHFDGDPLASFGVYSALAQKIGFVKAERLLENQVVLNAEAMHELCLVKQVVEADNGLTAIERYVGQFGRRYNASYGIFRAQRMTMRPLGSRSDRAGALASQNRPARPIA